MFVFETELPIGVIYGLFTSFSISRAVAWHHDVRFPLTSVHFGVVLQTAEYCHFTRIILL